MNLLQKRSLRLLHFKCSVTIFKEIIPSDLRIGSPWGKLYQVPPLISLFSSNIRYRDATFKISCEGWSSGGHAVPDNQYNIEKVEVGSCIGCLCDRQWYVCEVQETHRVRSIWVPAIR